MSNITASKPYDTRSESSGDLDESPETIISEDGALRPSHVSVDCNSVPGQSGRPNETLDTGDLSEPLLGGPILRSSSSSTYSSSSSIYISGITSKILHNAPQKVTWNDLVWDLVFVAMCKTFSEFITSKDDDKEWSFKDFPSGSKFASLSLFIPMWRLWVHSVTSMTSLSAKKDTTDMYHADSYFYCVSMMLICCWAANLGRCLNWEYPIYCVGGDPNDTNPQHCEGAVMDFTNVSASEGTHWLVVDGLTTYVSQSELRTQDFPTNESQRKDGNAYWVCSDSSVFYSALRMFICVTYIILGFVGKPRHKKLHFWNALVNLVVSTCYWAMMVLGSDPTVNNIWAICSLFYFVTIFDLASGLVPFIFSRSKRFFIAVTREEAEVLGERFGLLLVICLGEMIMGAASKFQNKNLDHRNTNTDANWEYRIASPISAWDAWSLSKDLDEMSPSYNPQGWRTNPYAGRIGAVAMVYALKVLIFDAAIAEEQLGAVHPLARGGTTGEGAWIAELYKLTTFPIALCLIILGSVTENFSHHNTLITGLDGELCEVYNVALGCVLICTGLQLMLYGEKNARLKWLKMRKVVLRVCMGTCLLGFHPVYEYFSDDENIDGSGWQYMIILFMVLCVVINDVRCRDLAFKLIKEEKEAEAYAERETVKVGGKLAGIVRWCKKVKADWEAKREKIDAEAEREVGQVADMEGGIGAEMTVEMDAATEK